VDSALQCKRDALEVEAIRDGKCVVTSFDDFLHLARGDISFLNDSTAPNMAIGDLTNFTPG
jgi:hypothetical protein